MAQVVRFRPRQAIIEQEAAGTAAEMLRQIPEDLLQRLPPGSRQAISRAAHELQRVARPHEGIWPGGYSMLSRVQAEAVWEAIWTHPGIARRNQVARAFGLILFYLEQDTGEVRLSRAELAKKLGIAPHNSQNVSAVMSTLVRLGVLTRERRRLDGVQGPGEAVYFVNAHVAWNGSLTLRQEKAAKTAPPRLKVVKAGEQQS